LAIAPERWRLAGWPGGVSPPNGAMTRPVALGRELRDIKVRASLPFGGGTPPCQPAGRQRSDLHLVQNYAA
jgi:hypothetical protein